MFADVSCLLTNLLGSKLGVGIPSMTTSDPLLSFK
jgi:hypothetical protein